MADVKLVLDPVSQLVTTDDPSPTISVRWNRAAQQAVINTAPGPTVASRAYGIVHTAMFDAWAAYDLGAIATTVLGDTLQRPTAENTDANKTEAMSFAAYRVLVELFPTQRAIFDTLMAELGYNTANVTVNTRTAAGIGNVSAETLMVQRRQDGSNQLGGYADTTGYTPANPNSDTLNDPERWTPEYVPIDSAPGDPDFIRQQRYLTPHWGTVDTFGVSDVAAIRPVAPKPFFLPNDPTTVNPEFIAQTQRVIDASANLTDEQKSIAEFWEDGRGTSFPPGTWMTFGQFVSGRDDNSIDDDAVLFAALGNAVLDAGIATWEAKVFYDYLRPVQAVRELGRLGLIGDPITVGGPYAINAWAGPGLGTGLILAEDFLTYQTPGGDPSPPFSEYTSGHSAFSAAGAEILRLFTGNNAFGTSVTFQPGQSRFEPGTTPGSSITLAWDTFTEAADEAGLSRIYGGIHFEDGDLNGRALGRNVGGQVWNQLQSFLNGATTINLEFSVAQISTTAEIGVFVADDANGTIDGLAPGDVGYTAAALARSAVLFSPVSNSTDFVSEFSFNSTRSFISGSYLNFFSITDGTVDTYLSGGSGTVSFSSSRQITGTGNNFSLDIEGVNISAAQVNTAPTGVGFQGVSQAEIIDLTSLTAAVNVTLTIQREAYFDNIVGFYEVDDLSGQITDNAGNAVSPGVTTEYIQAALGRRVADISLAVEANSVTTINTTLEAGKILAPFIVVNGTIEDLLDVDTSNDPAIYFPFMGANADRVDHVRLYGDNIFGFEDMAGGGDTDYDDMTIQVKFA
ncbi:DUF6851 domain-containing protein [Leptothoe sp. PORK10 BA2]|uniref:DUF6851 domain-containing protein n=1 Tax=Leptothoe sp. PORK10 BA2 TaxID=3110254 RepID=UPI002B21AC1E|nr:DUF4114 domain-containing protein [Leptothoe sp. PORK10 BA2]MEA5464328.1 DUF4114 domain-containing protein [Leptothoe sp. PORK10 BA2]